MKNKATKSYTICKGMRFGVLLLLLVLCSTLMLFSCGSASINNGGSYAPGAPELDGDYVSKDEHDDYIDNGYTSDSATGDVISGDRKIIKTVRETVQTTEYAGFINALRAKVNELGGYISDATYNDDAYQGRNRYASLTIRIPADKLELFTGATRELATVIYHNETANDITGAYLDVDSRISVLEAEEKSLLAMLEKVESLSDALTVKKQLSSIQGDLASLRAQKNSYDSRIAYSTIYMTVNEVKEIAPPAEQGFGEELGGRFLGSLGAVGDFFRGVGLWLLGDSPIIILFLAIGVVLFLLVRFIIKRLGAASKKKVDGEDK